MKKAVVVVAGVMVLITAWVGFNPIGRFGFCRFGLLVYSAVPFPGVDLVIHVNGLPAVRGSKAHWKLPVTSTVASLIRYERLSDHLVSTSL